MPRRAWPRRLVLAALFVGILLGIGVVLSRLTNLSFVQTETIPAGVRLADATLVERVPDLAPAGAPTFLASDAAGNLAVSDRNQQRILRFDADGHLIGSWGPSLPGGIELKDLAGLASSGSDWFVLDRGTNKVYRLDPAGSVQATIDLDPQSTYGPNGLAVDASGDLFIADTGRNRLLKFGADGQFLQTIGSPGTGLGELKQPMAVAAGPDQTLFVADWENERIQQFDSSLRAVDAFGTRSRPWTVVVDHEGRVYVPDADHRTIQVFSSGGILLAELGGQDGPTLDVNFPTALALGADGNTLWVVGSQGLVRLRLESVPETAGVRTRVDFARVLGSLDIALLVTALVAAWFGRKRLLRQAHLVAGAIARQQARVTSPVHFSPHHSHLPANASLRANSSRPDNHFARPLVVAGVILAAAGQWVLVALPHVQLPAWLQQTIQPVWPDAGPALVAVALFILAMVCFGWGIALRCAGPGERGSDWRPPEIVAGWRRGSAVVTLAGILVCAAVTVGLALGRYAPLFPPAFALGTLLVIGGLAWRERAWPHSLRFDRSVSLELVYVLVAMAVFGWLASFDLSSWYYSSIGDEHAFFGMARDFAQHATERNLFSQNGVYGYHPVLTSFIDGMFMRVLGKDGVSWKISTNVLVALSIPLLYLLARANFGRRVAVLAVGLLVTAHYLLAFAHTGYNNLEPLCYALAALLCFQLGLRRGSLLLLVLAGMFAGLGWYTFYTSRTVLVIMAIALLVMVPRDRWLPCGLPILAGFCILFLPFLATNGADLLTQMLRQSSINSGEAVSNRTLLPYWNAGRSLLAFNYNTYNSLYTSGSLLEPVTAAWFVLGLAYLLATRRDARSQLLLVWYGVGLFATGIASQYDHVTTSRLNFLLPMVVLTAALAVDRFLDISASKLPAQFDYAFNAIVIAVLLGGVGASNLNRWFVVTPQRTPSTPVALTMEVLEQQPCQAGPLPALVIAGPESVDLGGALDAGPPLIRPEVVGYQDASPWLSTAGSRCTIFPNPTDAAASDLVQQLEDGGAVGHPTAVRDRTGTVSITAFYPEVDRSAPIAPVVPTPIATPDSNTPAELSDVHGIAADTRGNVYVADAAHRRVVKFSFANGPVVQIDSQQGSDHALTEPFKVAVDSQDRLYVLDVAAADVKRYLPDGTYQATLLQGIGMYSPRGLVVDTSDRLWIADTGRNRVLEVTPDGQLLREWDQVDGRDLDQPTSVAPDGSGGAYIAEPESGLVVHIDEAGQSLGSRHIAESDTRSGPDLLALGTGRVLMTDPQRGKLEVLGPGLQEAVDWVSATPPMAVTSTYGGDIWLMNAGADAPREIGIPPE